MISAGALAYEAMLKASQDTGWPEAYADDLLVHDRKHLTEGYGDLFPPPIRFVWMLRRCGTHVVVPQSRFDLDIYLNYHPHPAECRLYTWDGVSLVETDVRGAKAFLERHFIEDDQVIRCPNCLAPATRWNAAWGRCPRCGLVMVQAGGGLAGKGERS